MRKYAVVFVSLLLLASAANAQYFGRNKVQWERFNFKILKTEHFDIYYYDREADVVNDVGRQAERWYARLSRVFNHSFAHKPIVLYANPADFQQTTTTPEIIGQGTGGFTDPFMNRVVLPLTGDYAENDHVLGHELVHVFQFDIAASMTNNRRRFNLDSLPLWLVEGMAEYFSKGRIDPLTAMWIRDATIHNRMPDLKKLTRDPYYFPYRYGQALLAYIGGRFGDDAVVRLFLAAGSVGPEAAFERATGIPQKQIFTDWQESAREMYNPVVEDRPFNLGEPLIGSKRGVRGYLNLGPAYSPDGRYLAFLSTRDVFDIDLFLADAKTGHVIRRLQSATRNQHYESLRFIDSAGAWSPDSKELAFVVFEKGDNYLGIVDVDGGHYRDVRIPGIDAINNVAWSPDGRTIAISGQQTGSSDLFLYDLTTKQVRRLTNDRYADMEPAFSPDGKTLAFVTDRGQGDLEQLHFTGMGIGTVDLSTGAIHMLPLFRNCKNIDPQFAPDSQSIYFVSNAEGVPDVYRYYFSDSRIARVTHVQTGVSGITEMSPTLTVSPGTGDIAFSLYEDDNYNIYKLPPTAGGVTMTTALPPEASRAAQLPPLRGTGSAITAYLEQPAAGLLPDNTQFTQAAVSNALHLAYLGPPTIGVGVSSFGTGVAGSVSAYFSDVLGENNVGVSFEGGGTGTSGVGTFADQLAGEVFYLNQTHRWNWGVDYTHLPYVSVFAGAGFDTSGNEVIQQEVDIWRYDDISGIIQYPFSTTNRVEFSGGFQRQSLHGTLETATIVGDTIINDTKQPLAGGFGFNLERASAAYVHDSSIFGFLSPIMGSRYRYEVDALTGDLHFNTALVDYRHYWLFRPVTIAVRGIHYGRYGRDADNGQIQPLYIGDPSLVHGYDIGSIRPTECVPTASDPNGCPVFDRLIGSRIAVANLEVRVPLFGTREWGLLSGFLPTELFAFTDAGIAWSAGQHPNFHLSTSGNSTDRIPSVSVGGGARILLSYIPLEFYWAKPFQRPQQGWTFGFNIIPGW
ncbi:MAG TPA: BamA/TamA family outer membrane protein [Thermoanaerobaculia bacterium]|nr:BamA/TamA family outer membrane protein [Thermoanaerobaculia bacterium]